MSHDQVSLAKDQLYQLFKVVRKEAVPLVDAFDFPDKVLNSALGRYDGDVYNHLFKWAQKAPRNKKKVGGAEVEVGVVNLEWVWGFFSMDANWNAHCWFCRRNTTQVTRQTSLPPAAPPS